MKKSLITAHILIFLLISPSLASQTIDSQIIANLSTAQIEKLKNGLSASSSSGSDQKPISESTIKIDQNFKNSSDKKFGYDYFLSAPTTVAAVGDLPLPNEYRVSLNDQFTIILSGAKEDIFDLNVNLDGTILFPELGSIYVAGETFKDVKVKLRNIIEQSYIGVEIDLSLKNLSAKKITIVGAVNAPGTYLVNPFSTISSALAYSGGISEIGTLRNIKLIRTNGETFNFDLYNLLINGDRSNDITIESGDVILIEPAENFIKLSGEVKRQAVYEVKNNETLDNLINFGLGFTKTANRSNINIDVLDIKSTSIQNLNISSMNIDLANVLEVKVNPYVNKRNANINVEGAIKEPGFYPISEYKTLKNLINRLEFVDVYPWLAVLSQFDEDNLIKSSILFSLKDPDTYESIELLPNSKIYFANINTRKFDIDPITAGLVKDYTLKLSHKQGIFNIPVYGRYDVKSFIDLLGLDMSDVNFDATYISPLDSIVISDDYRNMQFIAKKYHTVTFRSPVNDLITVTIKGAIDYPGNYTLQSSSTIHDLYQQVGGFKEEAFLDGVIFIRDSIRNRQIDSINKSKQDLNKAILTSAQRGLNIGDISIIQALSESINPEYLGRIAGNFSPESISSKNTILFDGDVITIPMNPNVINVLGEVLNPTAFEYTNDISVRSAIETAGGFQDYADKRKVYVIKANGLIEKVNRNVFVKNVSLEPGDTIVVPRKIITNNPGIDALLPVTKILSDLAFSAAAIKTLSNNN